MRYNSPHSDEKSQTGGAMIQPKQAAACAAIAIAVVLAAGGLARHALADGAPTGEDWLGVSTLDPENLSLDRPAAPFDLTGLWFVDVSFDETSWWFGPPFPELTPAGQAHYDASVAATAEGRIYRDDIGQCWPAGMPLIMTRFWPIAMIQLPTSIYMISHFMNSVRIVYMDGRTHTDPDIVVPSFNGESIGWWEGDELVIDSRHFPGHHHWMSQGEIAVPASDQLRIIERVRMADNGQLEIEFTMTDPVYWIGEWKSTKRWNRVRDGDITEVTCFPSMNENLPSTSSESLLDRGR
jgi:hypothetical protein